MTAWRNCARNLRDSFASAAHALPTQRCLAHALPGYMTMHPKVSVFVEATDRTGNLVEERFDIAIRAQPVVEDVAELVAKRSTDSKSSCVRCMGVLASSF